MGEKNDTLAELWAFKDATMRIPFLLSNEILSDVTFFIGRDRKKVPGHSFVLVLCSWDFYNVFHLLKLDSYDFTIEDVEYDSFMVFLEYCYTLKVDLSQDNSLEKTVEILKLAHRFKLPSLVEICKKHISKELDGANVMIVYKHRMMFSEDSEFLDEVFGTIQKFFSPIIQLDRDLEIFVNLPLEAVRSIAKLSPINCDEIELFDVLMKWAKKNCEKNGISPSPKRLRIILKDVFYEIRFPTMKGAWFIHIISNYIEMFTKEEIVHICKKIDGKIMSCPGFNCEPRLLMDFVYKIFSFGHDVVCYDGVPDMKIGTTKKMISNFCAGETKKLIGFAFVVQKNEEVNVASCKLKISHAYWKSIVTAPGERSKFNWDYDLIAMKFAESQKIMGTTDTENYNVQLVCELDKYVRNICREDSPYDVTRHRNLNIRNHLNTIPYLILEK